MQDTLVWTLGWEDPLERMATLYSILAWRILMDKGAWRAAAHRVAKSRTHLSSEHTHRIHHSPDSWRTIISLLSVRISLFWTFHTNVIVQYVSWLLSLSMFSRSIHLTTCTSGICNNSFYGWIIVYWMTIFILFIHLSLDLHLGCLYILFIVHRVTFNVLV